MIVEVVSVGDKTAENVSLLEVIERYHRFLQVLHGVIVEILDFDLEFLAHVVMVSVIDDAGLDLAWEMFIDDVIDYRGVRLLGAQYIKLIGG